MKTLLQNIVSHCLHLYIVSVSWSQLTLCLNIHLPVHTEHMLVCFCSKFGKNMSLKTVGTTLKFVSLWKQFVWSKLLSSLIYEKIFYTSRSSSGTYCERVLCVAFRRNRYVHYCFVYVLAERCLQARAGQVGKWKRAKSGRNFRIQTGWFGRCFERDE